MSELLEVIELAIESIGVRVLPPVAFPEADHLPAEVREFYGLCGGMFLFEEREFPLTVVQPERYIRSNAAVLGEEVRDDRSHHWYLIAEHGTQYVSIDSSKDREGLIYDSFFDCHGIVDSCAVIANSLAEFLTLSLATNGENHYWLAPHFVPVGYAYD